MTRLTGTQKQVDWANDIRTEMLQHVDKARQEFEGMVQKAADAGEDVSAADEIRQVFDQAEGIVEAQTEAKWFIDNRHLVIHPKRTVQNIVNM